VRINQKKTWFVSLLILASLVLSACSKGADARPTEQEIVIDPNEGLTEQASTPMATPTLRSTPTPEPAGQGTEMPTPTNTLNPYESLIFEGIQLSIEQQYDAAFAKFGEAIEMDPTTALAYLERGKTNTNTGKFDEAITDLNFAINYDPENADAYNARGVAWQQKDQPDQAIKDYNKALELQPDFVNAINNRAVTMILKQDYVNALLDFSKVVELTPDNPEAYFNRGQAYLSALPMSNDTSYIDLCIADFTQALAFQPEDADSLFNRGLCLSFKGDLTRTMEDYTAAIALDPTRANYYLFRAALYPDMGTRAQALSDAQKVLELSQDLDIRAEAEKMLAAIPGTPEPTPGPTPTPLS
jgi:tetratricopeptide (TPR) repeat protein